jgi:hypothetical protein
MRTLRHGARGALLLAWAVLLSACGGGGGASGNGAGDPPRETPAPNFASTPPPQSIVPMEPPTLRLTPTAIKTLRFDWADVSGETEYRLLEDADGASAYETIARLPANATQHELPVFLPARLNARYRLQACRGEDCLDSAEVAVTGTLAPAVGYAKASPAVAQQRFGYSIALSARGDWLAIGALNDGDGAVHVFQRERAGWRLQRRLTAGDAAARKSFGAAVALSAEGEVLAVGAYQQEADNNGAVYLFRRNGNQWTTAGSVKAPVSGTSETFGHSLALSGDGRRLAVGAYDESSLAPTSGAVHVFDERDGLWSVEGFLKASPPATADRFGDALALSSDGLTLAVGAPTEKRALGGGFRVNSGAVYVYARGNGNWPQQAYLKASDAANNSQFGYSLALSANGDRLAVGAPYDDRADIDAGAVYLFSRQGAAWSETVKLAPWHATRGGRFGFRVKLSGDGERLAVSTPYDDSLPDGSLPTAPTGGLASGSAYVFRHGAQGWERMAHLKAPNASPQGQFGSALAFSGDGQTLAVSAADERHSGAGGIGAVPRDDGVSGSYSGAVYLY